MFARKASQLQREAELLVPKEFQKQLELKFSDQLSEEDERDDGTSGEREPETTSEPASPTSPRSSSLFKSFVKSLVAVQPKKPISVADVQPFEIMKAVEDRNITFLMEVRDRAFPLLLQTSGGETPLVHAIRIGNRDVAIVLLGAFSRWINRLEAEDIVEAQVQSQLKALRVGLKLAINEGLAHSQPDLIASFMQTLVMSEGDNWVWAQVSLVARALNGTADGKPVQTADAAIRKFTTKELGKASLIASVEDYIANAIADLLVMGAWSIVRQNIPSADAIPSYYFARDDRVYKAFLEQYQKLRPQISRSCPRRLRWQLQILKDGLQGRQISFRKKIEAIAASLDREEHDR
ncbi:hypothetical protein CC1G_00231 [Coprinopsis cinerea okayama7|uniref:Uncharacterized protein n=1 Tax=Coprinopsis cinerea (strain Okayama-7 / 130 / ATCC MYA-4618 / FGSC 9003) TaxID=240176 RepID=A8NX84_COPC7|nr:hypothetical protein CC1G_00231 [Coprinopsis cinerea okayama7\|eukprot:XP_001837095.1 hypothetical protein CC1G_00231 [Coprinopsis cinerea okayama7\